MNINMLKTVAGVLAFTAMALSGTTARAQALNVCCTIPDLGSLVQEIGGNQVSVTVFCKGTEDPHFVSALPSFAKSLSRADLVVHVGMQLEIGWMPPLLQTARNGKVLAGASGNLDCSTVIQPLEIPQGAINRAQGDVHPGGNPHYWNDPLNGLRVAALIRDKLIELRPNQKSSFEERYDAFAKRLAAMMVGEELAKRYSVEEVLKLALLFQHGKLGEFLKSQDQDKLLGGWFGKLLPYYGTKIVDDHSMWTYFARTFGLKVLAHMEPKPGLSPTTQHLGTLVDLMKRENAHIILTSAYYDPRHAQFLASRTGSRVVAAANIAGARPGTEKYLDEVDYNVRELVKALEAGAAVASKEGK